MLSSFDLKRDNTNQVHLMSSEKTKNFKSFESIVVFFTKKSGQSMLNGNQYLGTSYEHLLHREYSQQ